jgi:hypothetical protein
VLRQSVEEKMKVRFVIALFIGILAVVFVPQQAL